MPNPIHVLKYQVFRQMLLDARKAKVLQQVEVADRLGTTHSFVSKYERGEDASIFANSSGSSQHGSSIRPSLLYGTDHRSLTDIVTN